MKLLRKYLEKVRAQNSEIQNPVSIGGPGGPAGPETKIHPEKPEKYWDQEESREQSVLAQQAAQPLAQGGPESPLETLPEVQALLTWTSRCRGGETWRIPLNLLPEVENLRAIANKSFRQRNPRLYALREFEDQLCCKVWVLGDSWPNHRFGTR